MLIRSLILMLSSAAGGVVQGTCGFGCGILAMLGFSAWLPVPQAAAASAVPDPGADRRARRLLDRGEARRAHRQAEAYEARLHRRRRQRPAVPAGDVRAGAASACRGRRPGGPAGRGSKTMITCGEFADSTSSPHVFHYDHSLAAGRRGRRPLQIGRQGGRGRLPEKPTKNRGLFSAFWRRGIC